VEESQKNVYPLLKILKIENETTITIQREIFLNRQ
jgi:hypothetical protein